MAAKGELTDVAIRKDLTITLWGAIVVDPPEINSICSFISDAQFNFWGPDCGLKAKWDFSCSYEIQGARLYTAGSFHMYGSIIY